MEKEICGEYKYSIMDIAEMFDSDAEICEKEGNVECAEFNRDIAERLRRVVCRF